MRLLTCAFVLIVLIPACSGAGSSSDAGLDMVADLPDERAADELAGEVAGKVDAGPADLEPEVVEPLVDPGIRLREEGWLRGDLHMHTIHSDGDDDTATVVALAEYLADETFVAAHPEFQGNHLDFISITDHRTLAVADDPDFVSDQLILIPGEEYGGPGHAGLWGISEVVHHDPDGDGATIEDYLAGVETTHAQGGCFSFNHPYDLGTPFPWDVRTHDGIEIWNVAWALTRAAYTMESLEEWEAGHGPASPLFRKGQEAEGGGGSAQALRLVEAQLARGIHVAVVGGSDRHAFLTVGFPATWVKSDKADEEGILDGVRARHTFVSRNPVAATVEMTLSVDGAEWQMGDQIPLADGTHVITVNARVGRADGGLLRIVLGHHVETDEALADAELGKPVLEAPIVGDDFTAQVTVTVQPGDWLYPTVYEPLVLPGLPNELADLVPGMAANASDGGSEDFGSIVEVFWDVMEPQQALAPDACDPGEWDPMKLQCLPPDKTGVATFYVPDWVDRVANVLTEDGAATEWCMGAVGSAVMFVEAD
jgi:hypothetical protein